MAVPPLIVAIIALAGALAAGATALSHPRMALGILFALASFSSATLETQVGTMRLEMPAIAVVAVVLLWGGRFAALRRLPRSTAAIAVAFAVYLAVLALASAVVAPGPAQSLHMVAWFATSMLGGVVAFLLLWPKRADSMESLAVPAAALGGIGIFVGVMFLIAWPGFSAGIQDPFTIFPRVKAFGWEANLYASFLGMSVFFAVEVSRGPRKRFGLLMVVLIVIGFALGMTRGAYVGLAAGILAYAAVRIGAERRLGDLPRYGALVAVLIVAGFATSSVVLPNPLQRPGVGDTSQVPPASPALSGSPALPGSTSSTGSPGSSALPGSTGTSAPPSASPSPAQGGVAQVPTPSLSLVPYPDTLAFRLERVPVAFDDFPRSPLIGFGAESFGQLHPDRSAGGLPDHIAIMAVVVPYEAGVIGGTAAAIGFVLLLGGLWRFARRAGAQRDWRTVGAVAAFTGSLVSMLVAYQSNNAFQFAINWIVIGAAAALIVRDSLKEELAPVGD